MKILQDSSSQYTGVDVLRVVCAFLVIAIHTSPLLSFGEAADFYLTHAICRIAVPFFFVTSGFFLISRYREDTKALLRFIKKTLLLYGVSILLYLPVNIYSGLFRTERLVPALLQDLFFDGTLYHLWYLPASVIGAVIAWFSVKKFRFGPSFAITGVLYLIGLFGDSYYGVTAQSGVLSASYDCLFQIMDYTRNGLFFAPLFFVLGGFLADRRYTIARCKSLVGFLLCLFFLCAEAGLVRHYEAARHDSMYFFLLPCIAFLFLFAQSFSGKRRAQLRFFSLCLYLLHPLMILIVRLVAKNLLLTPYLIDNTFLHFLAVSFLSAIASYLLTVLWQLYAARKAEGQAAARRAYLTLDLAALKHNLKELTRLLPKNCNLMAVVKAEAYGHGAFETAAYLDRLGVRAYAVATIDEAIRLRRFGIRGCILILGYTDPARAKELKKYKLTQTVTGLSHARALADTGFSLSVHIKIDTGMHRLGVPYDAIDDLVEIMHTKPLTVTGIYSHFACADSRKESDIAFTKLQLRRFLFAAHQLKSKKIPLPKLHIQSSYGLLNYPEIHMDYVRCGIALYGVLSRPHANTVLKPNLRPALSLNAQVVHVQRIKAGESVGYDRAFVARKDSVLATVSIGYADGLSRCLSETGGVLLHGQFAPFAGRISMDQAVVDVTDIKNVGIGDTATVIDGEKDSPLSAEAVASRAQTISNELLSRLGSRLRT